MLIVLSTGSNVTGGHGGAILPAPKQIAEMQAVRGLTKKLHKWSQSG